MVLQEPPSNTNVADFAPAPYRQRQKRHHPPMSSYANSFADDTTPWSIGLSYTSYDADIHPSEAVGKLPWTTQVYVGGAHMQSYIKLPGGDWTHERA